MKITLLLVAALVTGCAGGPVASFNRGIDAGAWSMCNYPFPYIPTGGTDKCARLYHDMVVYGSVTPPPNYYERRAQND